MMFARFHNQSPLLTMKRLPEKYSCQTNGDDYS